MRKVIGIGETILDILFKNGQPTAAVPGGSVFNGMISLGRLGINVSFISEVGNDKVGDIILDFMKENGVSTQYVSRFPDGKSPVSLAFLNERNDAEYVFYKDAPNQRLDTGYPEVCKDDIVAFGSYFSLNPVLRDKVSEFLSYASQQGAILYYDPNFRSAHKNEALKLAPAIIENLEYADIVRGADQDFMNMYNGMDSIDQIYRNKIGFYCPVFLCTSGEGPISLRTGKLSKEYKVPRLETVSTVGAGDSFNAGIIYGLLEQGIRRDQLNQMDETEWDKIIGHGINFSSNVCMSLNNYISKDFAATYGKNGCQPSFAY